MQDYSNDTFYKPGDKALYQGVLYQAKVPSWGKEPNSTDWYVVTDNVSTVDSDKDDTDVNAEPYDASKFYKGGEVVNYESKLYRAKQSSWGNAPPSDAWELYDNSQPEESEEEGTEASPETDSILREIFGNKPDESESEEPNEVAPITIKGRVIVIKQHGHDGKDGVSITGPQGIQGNAGRDGKDGRDGIDGLSIKGDKGKDGKDGRDGVDGKVVYVDKSSDEDKKGLWTLGGGTRFTMKSVGAGYSIISAAKPRAADIKSIVAGANVTITDNGTSLTIASSGSGGGGTGITWNEVTTTSVALAVNNGYVMNNASTVVGTLPAVCAFGTVIRIAGKGAGGWRVAQNAGQTIHFDGNNTATGTSGFLNSQTTFDCVEILCITANTDFLVASSIGNITGNA